MKVIELKCPNCGAPVARGTMKCEYCGANFILAPDGSLTFRGTIVCPKCGLLSASGSWLCISCGEVITEDVQSLKELQRKIRFDQERTKNRFMPAKLRAKIEPDEFVHFCLRFSESKCFVVTDKRLIKFEGRSLGKLPRVKLLVLNLLELKWVCSVSQVNLLCAPMMET